jgi:hypothetical protein
LAKAFQNFAKHLADQTSPSCAPLRKLIAPYLRWMKTDRSVIADLPDKTEVKAYCGKQAALYQTRGPSTLYPCRAVLGMLAAGRTK